ncbi:hypothetical protein ACHRV1_24285 [Flavobacterium aquidurense]|jgi:hypothetical protein|uniref:hypothetical protein n=1 Tax=Flavobacterium aquidurense TaxID=362413 RepID=UPI0009169963|nr:hypothetical protein [Flavobacterium aquidurense]OXA72860.1 hypothetical protein B0A67_06540 [Flavobacterium aquidurense]SHG08522.1 hypothetical protein SAMN05444481_10278 [Flavobacterium frigidimaris]
MISTRDFKLLPAKNSLQHICKAISVLDAIICPEWEYRYYSYNSKWGEGEEFSEMRDGSGDLMQLLFLENSCVINGFAHEFQFNKKTDLTQNLPEIYNNFIFGEPVASYGTTFCLWTNETGNWQTGLIEDHNDNSEELLAIFDGNPQTYIDWATEYFEDSYKETGIPLKTVTEIYQGTILTREMVLSIVDEIEDWKLLEEDLKEINYPFDFK